MLMFNTNSDERLRIKLEIEVAVNELEKHIDLIKRFYKIKLKVAEMFSK